jgi:hypothetical protein
MFKNRKTSELTGVALNWAVSKAEGFDADALVQLSRRVPGKDSGFFLSKYTTDWAKGGPIMEREKFTLMYDDDWKYNPTDPEDNGERWMADSNDSYYIPTQYGATPLIAAMRFYVASKLGAIVEIPEELE